MDINKMYIGIMAVMLIATTIGSLSIFVIGTIAKLIIDDLNISYSLMGLIISIQRVASTLAAPFMGYMIDYIGPFKVLSIAISISATSSMLTSLAYGLEILLLSRVIAGFIFPAYWPSCTKITSLVIPRNIMGLATAVFESGSVIGVVLTYILIPYINSWRVMFIVIAILSFISLVPLLVLFSRYTKFYHNLSRKQGYTPLNKALLHRKALIYIVTIFFAFMFALQPWAFYTSWLSTFLVEKLMLELKDVWIPVVVILIIGMFIGISTAVVSDRIGGLKGRRLILSIALGITSISLCMSTVMKPGINTWIFLAISIIAYRAFLPLAWTIINDTVPENFAGIISGINALAGQIAMAIAPLIMAYTRDALGSFDVSVIIIAILTAFSILLYLQLKPINVDNNPI
jgi:MFS family permease